MIALINLKLQINGIAWGIGHHGMRVCGENLLRFPPGWMDGWMDDDGTSDPPKLAPPPSCLGHEATQDEEIKAPLGVGSSTFPFPRWPG